MTTELFIALATFCFVTSITPGPNNLMLLSSGLNFGFTRSLGHMFGIALGFSFMVLLVGIGLGQIFQHYPFATTILKWLSIAYLAYLAYQIANTQSFENVDNQSKPFNFMQAALFQWVNPKAWTMALSVNAVYAAEQTLSSVLLVSGVFLIINLPAICCWLLLGKGIKRFITSPMKMKFFNWLMASLLVASFIPML